MRTIAVCVFGLVAACYGDIGSVAELPECATHDLPVQPLRRLSSTQYRNVLVDLLGAELAVPLQEGSLFPPTVITRGFLADADNNTVNSRHSNMIEDEAERIARTALADPGRWLRTLLPCDVSGPDTDAAIDGCIDAFIKTFGTKAYRRPITSSEIAIAKQVYTTVRQTQRATEAWAATLQFFMQAPALLYRVEHGAGEAPGRSGLIKLTPYEMASRLSFMFLDSGPDDELYTAAETGKLTTRAQVAAQARRLIASPRFFAVLDQFHRDWLHLQESGPKDPTRFPTYTAEVQASLAREPGELVRYVLEQGDGSVRSLLGTTEFPVDATLAAYYGLPATPSDTWQMQPEPGRRGILTLGSVQAALAKNVQSSPIHRGNFLRSAVLCEPPLMLPGNIDTATPLEATAQLPTARERLAPLTSNPQCAGCHKQINPIGFAFEVYDAGGQVRTTENGAPIDPSGELDLGLGPLTFSGPEQLAEMLSTSPKVQQCYQLQWFRAATGRSETPQDACSIATVDHLVKDAGGDIRELLIALTQTDAFLYRKAVE